MLKIFLTMQVTSKNDNGEVWEHLYNIHAWKNTFPLPRVRRQNVTKIWNYHKKNDHCQILVTFSNLFNQKVYFRPPLYRSWAHLYSNLISVLEPKLSGGRGDMCPRCQNRRRKEFQMKIWFVILYYIYLRNLV